MPTLKGTKVSLSYVQCFLYLVSSSINVSIFHITWLDTFWIYLVQWKKIHQIERSGCLWERRKASGIGEGNKGTLIISVVFLPNIDNFLDIFI